MKALNRGRLLAVTSVVALMACVAFTSGVATASVGTTYTQGCKNSVTGQFDQVNSTINGTASPDPVATGGAIALTNLSETISVPGSIFAAGYNIGLYGSGPQTFPASLQLQVEGVNTTEGTVGTNFAPGSVSTVVSDPDGTPGTGDETATDGSLSVTFNDMTFHASGAGPVSFREDTILPLGTGLNAEKGGNIIRANVNGLNVRFACNPGSVAGSAQASMTTVDPAPAFASTSLNAGECFGGTGSAVVVNGQTLYVSPDVTAVFNATTGRIDVTGTNGDDVIVGPDAPSNIDAKAGNDKVCGGSAQDLIYGGAGNDQLSGNGGNDIISGGNGDDTITGGDGADRLTGGSGNDSVNGNDGTDSLDGDNGAPAFGFGAADVCNGGSGTDKQVGTNCETVSNIP